MNPTSQIICRDEWNFTHPASISVDGDRIIVNAPNTTNIRTFSLATGTVEYTLKKHPSGRESWVSITNDGKKAIALTASGYLYVWDLNVGGVVNYLNVGYAESISVTLDGKFAALVGGGPFRLIDLKKETWVTTETALGLTSVALRYDGKAAVAMTPSGNLAIWTSVNQKWAISKFGSSAKTNILVLSPDGKTAIAAGDDYTLRVWDTGLMQRTALLEGHTDTIRAIAITPNSEYAVSGGHAGQVIIWDIKNRHRVITLKRHTDAIISINVSSDGVRLVTLDSSGLACKWDLNCLKYDRVKMVSDTTYQNAKVLIVGNTGVGKTALTNRLCTNRKPKKTKSSDAVWATQLTLHYKRSADKEEREVWLWDFAGQQDYRVVHQLYTDEASLAIFVFNPQDRNPFDGLLEWDRDLFNATHRPFGKLLVAGRVDVGRLLVSLQAINDFCAENGFSSYIETSSETGEGCKKLRDEILNAIDWDSIPYTASPQLFKKIKQGILLLKDPSTHQIEKKTLYTRDELEFAIRNVIQQEPSFTEFELNAVLALLHSPGIVWRLAFGDYVLLHPERINQYASAVIRTIRKREDGLGYIAEEQVLSGAGLDYGSMDRLPPAEETHVLRAMHHLLVSRGLCIRDVGMRKISPILIFPSLFKILKPKPELTVPLVSFSFSGNLDDIYATLIVRLHHTDLVKSRNLWLDSADFQTSTGKNIGIKAVRYRFGKADITIYCDSTVDDDIKLPFSHYVYDHIRESDPTVERVRHYFCEKCKLPVRDMEIVKHAIRIASKTISCGLCGRKIILFDALEKKFTSPSLIDKVRALRGVVQEKLDSESKERILVGETTALVARSGHIFRETPNQDHGIDGEIEFKFPDGRASGQRVYLQLKSGDSHLHMSKDGTEVFYADEQHVQYWLSHKYDVMLVVRTSDDIIRWLNITIALKTATSDPMATIHNPKKLPSRKIVFYATEFTVDSLRKFAAAILGSDSTVH